MLEPRHLHNIAHPLIDSIYLKKEYDSATGKIGDDILVICTKRGLHLSTGEIKSSFLADIDLIRDEVERKAGHFARIDIR